jgi:hypothetical protein
MLMRLWRELPISNSADVTPFSQSDLETASQDSSLFPFTLSDIEAAEHDSPTPGRSPSVIVISSDDEDENDDELADDN